ncbi:MAG: trehalose-6-phosphate synthase [Candidatus Omnitrophota bacterium]|nr:trehalose-6-phosphate synthase [Candidatus Omnitrophota bacterium]
MTTIKAKKRLQALVRKKLDQRLLIVVSNREPYVHNLQGGKVKVLQPAGGAVNALEPVVRSCNGLWIAHGSGTADRRTVNNTDKIKLPPGQAKYSLRRVWLSRKEEEGYYYGYSNRSIWPLCHMVYIRPTFVESDWSYYQKVNQKFADAVLEEMGKKEAIVWIQDYHLALLPAMIKKARPDTMVAHFWHIPWVNAEAFRICPAKKEILEGLLANDVLAFHIRHHCINFLDAVELELEARIDIERTSVIYRGHETLIRAFPISIDFSEISSRAESKEIKLKVSHFEKEFSLIKTKYKTVAFSLDRIDYTKGIPERLRAIDRFFEKYPQYKEKIVFIQIGALSRIHLKAYKELNDEIDNIIEQINWKHSTDTWSPVFFRRRTFDFKEKLALYRLSNLCIVSPLHDGMNLVAKEYIAAKNDLNGTLILSQFTGAARELRDAVSINPYDPDDFADKIKKAIEMPEAGRIRRMKKLREIVRRNNVYKWAGRVVSELEKIR